MSEPISEKVKMWDLAGLRTTKGDQFNQVHEKLTFLQWMHYRQYIPTQGAHHPDYETRLENWLENVKDPSDQRLLFELAPQISFFGKEEIVKLHQAALKGPIVRWLIEILKLTLDLPDLEKKLEAEIQEHTWYCPISDSMQISEFHHANNIGGIEFRPDWRSLAQFGDPAKIVSFMQSHKIGNDLKPLRQIVLLEDFIGSGTQMRSPDIATFISSLPGAYPVLLVPLIICSEGADYARSLTKTYPQFSFHPVIEIGHDNCISPKSPPPAGSFERSIYDISVKNYPLVEGDKKETPRPYGPFGFRQTGAQVVLYTNTPANTLPLIQHKSSSWKPLFERSARVK